MFTITIPKEINKREYTKTYYAGTDTYMDKLMLNDENAEINFSVKSYRTALPVSEICYYNTEYG